MVVVCQILIDKPNDGFHRAGDTITGVVKYAMNQPTQFKDIILSLKGESWCSWSATRWGLTTSHIGIDKHLTQETSLLETTDKTQTLPAGPYEYRFQFKLPKNIPPSFSALNGNVLYRISLELRMENMFNIITRFAEADVLVHNYLDPLAPETPMTYSVTKMLLRPLSIGKLKMTLKAKIASPCIRLGEKAELKLEIINESFVRIKCVRAELISTTVYTASCGTKKTETEKIKDCTTEISKIPTRRSTTIDISVPILEENETVQYSKMISREYKILLTARLPFPYSNIRTVVPIVI